MALGRVAKLHALAAGAGGGGADGVGDELDEGFGGPIVGVEEVALDFEAEEAAQPRQVVVLDLCNGSMGVGVGGASLELARVEIGSLGDTAGLLVEDDERGKGIGIGGP